ncbi:hypothetical protein K443DRAFT_238083 [Laccaria amethystina LaAM-08-1]|uniref:Uncharacterized protein n=1 Tax=Laccaria amethystina LaAM-08-1 TaxID=1095629 RepID=A0A0C9X8H4_9AGAR|nr:hypothetical protein K443DRAFT_238083 [Laccaria amethystina LaAM-08-1]
MGRSSFRSDRNFYTCGRTELLWTICTYARLCLQLWKQMFGTLCKYTFFDLRKLFNTWRQAPRAVDLTFS